MSNRPQDFFGSSPKTVLNKPFMHVQDQKPSGTDGGSSVAGWQTRVLNTVLHNDIQGASLSGNQVTLPAGTYYAEAGVDSFRIRRCKLTIEDDNSNVLLTGYGGFSEDSGGYAVNHLLVSGTVTLTETTVLTLRMYGQAARSGDGCGLATSSGEIEVYSDLRIWQLDRSLEVAPVAVNSGLQTVPGLDTTGNIMGFNLSKTGANQITVSKGSCLDSTLTVPLALTADTAVAIPAVANTIYHVFVVKLVADGSFTVKVYTSEAAVASDSAVDKWRWVGFCRTDGSAEAIGFNQYGDSIVFPETSQPVITPSLTTSYVSYSVAAVLPMARVELFWVNVRTSGLKLTVSFDGSSPVDYSDGGDARILGSFPNVDNIYMKYVNSNGPVNVYRVKIRR